MNLFGCASLTPRSVDTARITTLDRQQSARRATKTGRSNKMAKRRRMTMRSQITTTTTPQLFTAGAKYVHVYTRTNLAQAWKYEDTSIKEAAEVAREVNKGYGVETLLVPSAFPARQFLDSYQSQEDFEPKDEAIAALQSAIKTIEEADGTYLYEETEGGAGGYCVEQDGQQVATVTEAQIFEQAGKIRAEQALFEKMIT